MNTLRTVVGAKIKAMRKSKKMSQADLAELVGCDSPLISRYERGINLLGVDQLIRIAEAFKVAPGELLPSGQDDVRARLMSLRQEISELVAEDDSPASLEEVVKFIRAEQSAKKR